MTSMDTGNPLDAAESAPGPPPWSATIAREAEPIYERLRGIIPEIEWRVHAPYIHAINEWKRKRNAIVLAHNYQTPEIFHGVADRTGDSLALAKLAVETDADVIVLAGVHFMAETAKLLNPDKTVLIPDLEAGCSLASSITGAGFASPGMFDSSPRPAFRRLQILCVSLPNRMGNA